MQQTPFHAYYAARMLSAYTDSDKLVPAFASSNIDIYPYQIAAAQFALRSSYLKGCVLCSESSLGKTYEALLIMTQQWYEGKNRLLLVLPANMIRQWVTKIENSFSLPYIVIDNEDTWSTALSDDAENPFAQDALVITTYDFAVKKSEYIQMQKWDMTVFDEASRLANIFDLYGKIDPSVNKTAFILKKAVKGSFKLLLTPTPITKDILDIYGLLYFIDETILPDPDYFFARYFRKPENYLELASWVSAYCFRTLKSQVTDYVNFTNRIPYTVDYELTAKEKELYQMIEDYLALPQRYAYPRMDKYRLGIRTLYYSISSSPQAFVKTLDNPIGRLKGETKNEKVKAELDMLIKMQSIAKGIGINGKSKMLLSILKKCFARLKRQKISRKAIIFINYLETQDYLYSLLSEKGYVVLQYNGSNSRDYTIMERFRSDDSIQILLATDDAAKGLDIEFCPIVSNYDLLFNTIEMEQRICRCHRQAQKSDVVVINLLGQKNKADVRIMELVNKRILQFNGIFGMSDVILGNFDADIDAVLGEVRRAEEIQKSFDTNLAEHKDENKQVVSNAEDALFTTFTKEIAGKVTVTPQYIADKINALNDNLWNVVKWYFKQIKTVDGVELYEINEADRTVTARETAKLPVIFTYLQDMGNRKPKSMKQYAYKQYGMSHSFTPYHGRITIASHIARGILKSLTCEYEGAMRVDAELESCMIGFYNILFKQKKDFVFGGNSPYYIFTGITESGRVLSDAKCREIMSLPVLDYEEILRYPSKTDQHGITHKEHRHSFDDRRYMLKPEPHQLDTYVPFDVCRREYIEKQSQAQAVEIDRLKLQAANAKTGLQRALDEIQVQITEAEKDASDTDDRVKQMQAQKKLRVLHREFLEKEENLFLDGMKLDMELEEKITELINNDDLECEARRQFVIQVSGK